MLDQVVVRLSREHAVALYLFFSAAIDQMKEQASAKEWDSDEIMVMRNCFDALLSQLPKESA